MGMLDRFVNRDTPVIAPPAATSMMLGNRRSPGRAHSLERQVEIVLSSPTGLRATQIIRQAATRAPLRCYKPGTDELDTEHPLNAWLVMPEPGVSQPLFSERAVMDKLVGGRALWIKQVDDKGRFGLWRVMPHRFDIIINSDDRIFGFIVRDSLGRERGYWPHEVVCDVNEHPTRGAWGLGAVQAAVLAAETGTAAQRYNRDLLDSDVGVSGIYTLDGTPEQIAEAQAAMESGNPGAIRTMAGKGTFARVGLTNQELAYDRTIELSDEHLVRALGVPMTMLSPTDSTYANLSEAKAGLITGTIMGYQVPTAGALTVQLGMDPNAPWRPVEIRYDYSKLPELQEGEDAKVTRLSTQLNAGAITVNEYRTALGWEPLTDGGGDVRHWATAGGLTFADPDTGLPVAAIMPPTALATVPDKSLKALDAPAITKADDPAPEGEQQVGGDSTPSTADDHVGRMQRIISGILAQQSRVAVARLTGKAAKSADDITDSKRFAKILTDEYPDAVKALLGDVVEGLGKQLMNASAISALITWTVDDPSVQAWLKERASFLAESFTAETADAVTSIVSEATSQGVSTDKIAEMVKTYFDQAASPSGRAMTVARTESMAAANFAAIDGARKSGVVNEMEWSSAADPRTDPVCAALNGTRVAIGKHFPKGDPPLHPNCRCSALFIVDPSVYSQLGN